MAPKRQISPKNLPSYGRPNSGRARPPTGRSLADILAATQDAPLASDVADKLDLDLGPFYVTPVTPYYQGPLMSSRVAAHQFIPLPGQDNLSEQMRGQLRGDIYVRFIKKNSLYKYGPCSLLDYRAFRESSSKGRHVTMLEAFGYSPAAPVPELLI